jgi:hypothetical protein
MVRISRGRMFKILLHIGKTISRGMKMFMKLQHLGEAVQSEDKQPTPEEMGAFVIDFMTFSDQMNGRISQMKIIEINYGKF